MDLNSTPVSCRGKLNIYLTIVNKELFLARGEESKRACAAAPSVPLTDDYDVLFKKKKIIRDGLRIKGPVSHADSLLIEQPATLPDHTGGIMTWERDRTPRAFVCGGG